ncbi:MAG: hypothetical protein IKJ26_13380, partial [Clostridia bacterium]|nr:hypothetical protein [Clostridia bacterium]
EPEPEPEPEPVVPTFSLTVENGSGDQNGLAADASVSVKADEPAAGMMFDKWELVSGSGNFHSSANASTTFYLKGADAAIKATYKAIPTCTLTVENGSGGQSGLLGTDIVSIKADAAPEGQMFDKWELVSGSGNFYSSISPDTTFYMKGTDATVKATYKNVE